MTQSAMGGGPSKAVSSGSLEVPQAGLLRGALVQSTRGTGSEVGERRPPEKRVGALICMKPQAAGGPGPRAAREEGGPATPTGPTAALGTCRACGCHPRPPAGMSLAGAGAERVRRAREVAVLAAGGLFRGNPARLPGY